MEHTEATTRLLDTAETLFYQRGVQAVGMDEIRAGSGVSLKRLYQCFPSKEQLVLSYLRRRDQRWRAALADFVQERTEAGSGEQALLVFDWLYKWFSEPDFRGCAFINSFGELGAGSPPVVAVAREHKDALRDYLIGLLLRIPEIPARDRETMADHLLLLIDGAITVASIAGNPGVARSARRAAEVLLAACRGRACA
ncbi:MAG TPA: TetR/AcrR family transcriptional regulator [Amycolatopsis sp.]|nr:TetR/AcrR family transcriptional regulator [Amycolatopsis sp.]